MSLAGILLPVSIQSFSRYCSISFAPVTAFVITKPSVSQRSGTSHDTESDVFRNLDTDSDLFHNLSSNYNVFSLV